MVEAPWIFKQSTQEGGKDSGKVVSPAHRPIYLPKRSLEFISVYRLSRHQGQNAAGRMKSMKNFKHPTGNRTREFPVCSAVSQPIALPRRVTKSANIIIAKWELITCK